MKMYNIDEATRTAKKWADEALAAEVITSDFIPVNMWMVKYLGLDATLFLSAAYEELLYLRSKGKARTADSLFFSKRKAQQKTGLGEKRQKKAIEILANHNLINCRVENGIPNRRLITFSFGNFQSFKNELDDFILEDIISTKKERGIFNDKMKHIREAVNEARQQSYKAEWEAQHPGISFEEYESNLLF